MIVKETTGQSTCEKWFVERKKRVTASNFGSICKRRATTPAVKSVYNLLYNKFLPNKYC
jgi:hypothetical protein